MSSLSQKDKRALTLLLVALGIFAVIQFGFFPVLAQRRQLERKIQSRESGLAEMRTMQEEITRLSRRSTGLEELVAARPADFNLFAFLEKKCAETQVKDNITYMTPSDPSGDGPVQQVMVEMKLKGLQLNLLVSLLERIESSEHIVALQRIQIDVNEKNAGTLDVTMQVISLVRNGVVSE